MTARPAASARLQSQAPVAQHPRQRTGQRRNALLISSRLETPARSLDGSAQRHQMDACRGAHRPASSPGSPITLTAPATTGRRGDTPGLPTTPAAGRRGTSLERAAGLSAEDHHPGGELSGRRARRRSLLISRCRGGRPDTRARNTAWRRPHRCSPPVRSRRSRAYLALGRRRRRAARRTARLVPCPTGRRPHSPSAGPEALSTAAGA